MSIPEDGTVFPSNVCQLIHDRVLAFIDPDLNVKRRALYNYDRPQSVGIVPALWMPEDWEMVGPSAPQEPTIQRYTIGIQAFIMNPSEEKGIIQHSVLAHRMRNMLYRDAGFRTGMATMVATDVTDGMVERLSRWQVRQTRYVSNEINEKFFFLSTTELWFDVQVTPS